MDDSTFKTAATSLRARIAALALVALLLVAAFVGVSGVDSAKGGAAKIFGNVKGKSPKPSCPTPDKDTFPSKDLCLTYASVTGFQTSANGKKGIFKVPSSGSIVAWSVDLARPSKDEKKAFDGLFDGGPSARLSVLKKKGKGNFKLVKQSPTIDLKGAYGEKPIITLKKPLRVKKGLIVALTSSTWVPNFAHDGKLGSSTDKWRASRGKKKCGDDPDKSSNENRDDLLKSRSQEDKGSTRGYGCTYGAARILYWAYFAPDKKAGGKS